MKTVLITGGSGLIGRQLKKLLLSKNYSVTTLSRQPSTDPNVYFWDISKSFIDPVALNGADFIIHLAGAGIADRRWSKKRKQILKNSRIKSTKLLLDEVMKYKPKLEGFIAASGVGFYGTKMPQKIYKENDDSGTDFLARLCKNWEQEVLKFQIEKIRTVIFRTGIVLAASGGALNKISWPVRKGFGAVLGNGNQYMPWIHIDDLCNFYLYAIENIKINGIYNAVAPDQITNTEFTYAIAKRIGKTIWLPPIPSWLLKLFFGEMSDILLKGSRISAKKLEKSDFAIKYNDLEKALKDTL